jgi:hypothetical protein
MTPSSKGSTRRVVFEKDEEGNDDLTKPTTEVC